MPRYSRFSLATLFVFVAIIALLVPTSLAVYQFAKNSKAYDDSEWLLDYVESQKGISCQVTYHPRVPGELVYIDTLALRGRQLPNRFNRGIKYESRMTYLNLEACRNIEFRQIANCANLEFLSISETDFGSEHIDMLERMPRLRVIDIGGCKSLTKSDVEKIAASDSIERVLLVQDEYVPSQFQPAIREKLHFYMKVDNVTWEW